MATEAVAPRVARVSAAIVLSIQNKRVLVFQEELFRLPALAQCPEMTGNGNILWCFLKEIPRHKSGYWPA